MFERMAYARKISTPVAASSAGTAWLCALLSIVFHACVLFAWRLAPAASALLVVEADRLEVALVESAPVGPASDTVTEATQLPKPPNEPEEPTPETPTPEEPTPETPQIAPLEPEPISATPLKEPEMALPARVDPIPRPVSQPARKTAQPNPGTAPKAMAGKVEGGSGTASGTGKKSGPPDYLSRPRLVYPSESRAAGEQGTVSLRITVNAEGRPTAVSVARSSGFARLDNAAVAAGWRCRVRNAVAGAVFDAPMRFNLRD